MKPDLLEQATRALRAEHDEESAAVDGELARRRLERALAGAARRRPRARTVAVLLAASFAGATAWASASGRLPRWLALGTHDVLAPHETHVAPPRTGTQEHVAAPAMPTAEPSAQPVETSAALPEPSSFAADARIPQPGALPAQSGARATTIVRQVPAPTPHESTETPNPEGDAKPASPAPAPDIDALYRVAHAAQFADKNPSAALAAWDRYLAAAGPSGRMALEARYNRAITLVRLGRKVEAREALEPFARGEYGGYRREDAARLVQSLQ